MSKPRAENPPHARGRLRTWARRLVVTATVVAMGLGGLHLWARANVDTSTLARSLAWFEADVGDIDRFPQRAIQAPSSASPLPDCAEQYDLSTTVVAAGRGIALEELLATTRTRGFMVLQGGCVLAEHYGEGVDAGTLLTSFSVAKSVLATLIGIAVERGDLPGLDVPVTRYLPELAERDARFDDVTLASLMAMASGLRYEELGTPWSDDTLTYYGVDLRDIALDATIEEPPMTRWLYNNYNPLIAGMVLERATGTSVAAYAEEHLWRPLGAQSDASWSLDSTRSGLEKLESGFNATLRDWARFGLLAARRGVVGSAEIASPEFWDGATHPQRTAAGELDEGYGLWWWVDTERPDAFWARGNFGQFIYVDPTADVVVLRFGEDFGIDDWPDVLRRIAEDVGPS
ncbi:MAG TPA: serine hydrolase, partial [Acidimicrobiales bacterium]|nr:serine hydrolase [Acidimicrobiales bacterium]